MGNTSMEKSVGVFLRYKKLPCISKYLNGHGWIITNLDIL